MALIGEPVVKPAVAEKVYDKSWIKNLQVRSFKTDEAQLYVELDYVNSEGEFAEKKVELKVNDLLNAMAELPEVADAFDKILKAIPALIKREEDKKKKV